MIDKILLGLFSPLVGLREILSSPKNIGFSLVPFLIGLVTVGVGYWVAAGHVNDWVSGWSKGVIESIGWDSGFSLFYFIFIILFWILFSLVNVLVGYIFIIIVAGPFYALMVENIFKKELPDKAPRSNFKLALNMFITGLLKASLFLIIGVVCFVLAFIPVVNFVVPVLVGLTLAFDCTDYAFEVDFLTLQERFRFFRKNLWSFLGLALSIMVVGFIPGLFFVLLPAFICGASKMYIQLGREGV